MPTSSPIVNGPSLSLLLTTWRDFLFDTFPNEEACILVLDSDDPKTFLNNAKKAWGTKHNSMVLDPGRDPIDEHALLKILGDAKANGQIDKSTTQRDLIEWIRINWKDAHAREELNERQPAELELSTRRKYARRWQLMERLQDPSAAPLSTQEMKWLRNKIPTTYGQLKTKAVMDMYYISQCRDSFLTLNTPKHHEIVQHLRRVVVALSLVEDSPLLNLGYNEALDHLPEEFSTYKI